MVSDIPSDERFEATHKRLLTVSEAIIDDGLELRKARGLAILLRAYTGHPDIPHVLGNATRIAALPIYAEYDYRNPDLIPGFGPSAWILENARPQLEAFIRRDREERGILRESVIFSEDIGALRWLDRISQSVLPKGTYSPRAFAAGVALREIAPDFSVPYPVGFGGSPVTPSQGGKK